MYTQTLKFLHDAMWNMQPDTCPLDQMDRAWYWRWNDFQNLLTPFECIHVAAQVSPDTPGIAAKVSQRHQEILNFLDHIAVQPE